MRDDRKRRNRLRGKMSDQDEETLFALILLTLLVLVILVTLY
jgi:hypothetical protein